MDTWQNIRAWKRGAFDIRIDSAKHAARAAHPTGLIELSDEEMARVAGGQPAQSQGN